MAASGGRLLQPSAPDADADVTPSRLLCDVLTTIPDAEAGVFHHVGCEDVLLALGPSGSTAACALAQRGFGCGQELRDLRVDLDRGIGIRAGLAVVDDHHGDARSHSPAHESPRRVHGQRGPQHQQGLSELGLMPGGGDVVGISALAEEHRVRLDHAPQTGQSGTR